MAILTCKNKCCNKDFKSKSLRRKFCSKECYIFHKKSNPEDYKLGKFIKGQKSWNAGKRLLSVGSTKIEKSTLKSGDTRSRRFIFAGEYKKNGKPKYIRYDKYVWLLEKGSIPKGHVLWHKDGRTLNDDITNLEVIPFGEALSRYALKRNKKLNLKSKSHIEKIIVGCENGDRRIQKQLFEMMYSKMFSVALRYTSSHDAAKDVVSDAFIKVFKNIKKVKVEKGNLEAWIRRIVVNTAIDSFRKNGKKDYLTDSIDDEDYEYNNLYNKISSEENFSEKLDSKYIMEIIQELAPMYRTVFNMSVIDGCTHKEISDKLGIVEGTSKSNLSKAKAIVKKKILKLYKEEDYNILNLEEYCEPKELSYV